jgi:hypothetical protein
LIQDADFRRYPQKKIGIHDPEDKIKNNPAFDGALTPGI